ncbi:MAG: hypothetical protein HY242_08810 [Afipia sp.]|nr:hypothetical protein [Afipia sp.]
MIEVFSRATMRYVLATTIVAGTAAAAVAQQPTDAQRSAIRSSCRSDYEANCASVPPGGMASLQCLQKNMAKLSAACQSAVSAIEPAAPEPKAETAPQPKTDSAPAATTIAPLPSPAPKAATSAPPAKPANSGGSGAKTATPAASQPPASAATVSPPPAPAAAPAPTLVLRPMRPREELFVLRSACGGDVRAICGGIDPGGGRIIQCLVANAPALSPACKQVLSQFAAQ